VSGTRDSSSYTCYSAIPKQLYEPQLRCNKPVDAGDFGVEEIGDPALILHPGEEHWELTQLLPRRVELRWRHPFRNTRELSQIRLGSQ
jgi:hypothetical protein